MRIDCQALAEELAPLEVAWSATDPYAVAGPEIEAARWLLQCCQRGYELWAGVLPAPIFSELCSFGWHLFGSVPPTRRP